MFHLYPNTTSFESQGKYLKFFLIEARWKTSTYIEAFFKEDPKIISAYINENEKTRRKQKTGRFLQSVFAWNTFPLGATAPLVSSPGMLTSHKEKKMNETWKFQAGTIIQACINEEGRKKRDARTKRCRDELQGFSSRETSPPGNILGFSIRHDLWAGFQR